MRHERHDKSPCVWIRRDNALLVHATNTYATVSYLSAGLKTIKPFFIFHIDDIQRLAEKMAQLTPVHFC
jgi:hypothetical protein